MTQDRLLPLLERCEGEDLSPAEERELALLLEEPSNRAIAEGRLSKARREFGDLLGYHEAVASKAPAIPPSRLEALMGAVAPESSSQHESKTITFPGGRIPIALGAFAACLVVIVWMARMQRSADGNLSQSRPTVAAVARGAQLVIEYGVVAGPAMLRDVADRPDAQIGKGWRISALQTRAELDAWSKADFPDGVQARVWIDEEAGTLRAVYRQSDGAMATLEQSVDAQRPVRDQLLSVGKRIRGE